MHATRRCLERTPGLPFRRTLQAPPFQISDFEKNSDRLAMNKPDDAIL